MTEDLKPLLDLARAHAASGDDDAAKRAYVDVLQRDPTDFTALNELGVLAHASGHTSAAKTAFTQAVQHHPRRELGRLNLAHVLAEAGDLFGAKLHYLAVLATLPDCVEAHQGLARILTAAGDPAAERHWQKGFVGHATIVRPHRGVGPGLPVLLLTAARGGNVPSRRWVNDRLFAVTQIHAEFYDSAQPLPPHALVVNAIGDADLCAVALDRAETLLAGTDAPVVNHPARVRATGRVENARRLAGVPGVVTPRMMALPREALAEAAALQFPLLLRAPGHHTGRHFLRVESRKGLGAAAALPGDTLLAIEHLDAQGTDGLVRKYRVMFVDGVLLPLHLAIGRQWKLHYFSADMADEAAYREEERRFLDEMPGVLGARAIAALAGIQAALGLDYAGVDFALAPDGSVLLFEANATMIVSEPEPDPIWDYRRPAAAAVMEAVHRMLQDRLRTAPQRAEAA